MPLIDISVPIRPAMPIWPGNAGVDLELTESIDGGDVANVTAVRMGAHTGTHVDAPRPFLADGPMPAHIDPEVLVGEAIVADLTGAERLDAAAIESLDLPDDVARLLLKTSNSQLWEDDGFHADHLRLDGSGAQAILDLGIALVGIDYLSIGDEDAHRLLLGAGVVPLEGLDLRAVAPGRYTLICTALRLVGSDGAPARALLDGPLG
jgi:arylformamidase